MYPDTVARARRVGVGGGSRTHASGSARFGGGGGPRALPVPVAGRRADCAAERSEVVCGYVLVCVCV